MGILILRLPILQFSASVAKYSGPRLIRTVQLIPSICANLFALWRHENVGEFSLNCTGFRNKLVQNTQGRLYLCRNVMARFATSTWPKRGRGQFCESFASDYKFVNQTTGKNGFGRFLCVPKRSRNWSLVLWPQKFLIVHFLSSIFWKGSVWGAGLWNRTWLLGYRTWIGWIWSVGTLASHNRICPALGLACLSARAIYSFTTGETFERENTNKKRSKMNKHPKNCLWHRTCNRK